MLTRLSFCFLFVLIILEVDYLAGQELNYELGAIGVDADYSSYRDLQVAAGKLFFIKNNKLAASDGIGVDIILPDIQMTQLDIFGEINGKILFGIRQNSIGIWVSDGTMEGTQEIGR